VGTPPKGRKVQKAALGKPESVRKSEAQFYRCPEGHSLPNRAHNGNCTPIWCAGKAVRADKPDIKKKAEIVKTQLKALKKAVAKGGDDVELSATIQRAGTRRNARLEAVNFPEKPMEGGEAEDWADKKLVSLLPEAVAELEYKLKFGDDDQREKAADKIMQATGRGKREGTGGGGSLFTVILGTTAEGAPVPWMQRVTPKKLKEGEDAQVGS
jgi:hypothetical protein